MATTMKAYNYSRHRATPTVSDVPVPPPPSPGQLLIKVHGSSINPADYKSAAGEQAAILNFAWPRVYGFDFAGVVHAVPAGSSRNIGDKVFGMIRGLPEANTGTLAEFCLVDEAVCATCPDGVSFTDCASIPLVGITTVLALDACNIAARTAPNVLILGGAGGVGSVAIQIAKHVYGGTVTTTASAGPKTALCKSLGADVVVDYRSNKFEEVLEENSFDVIFDTTGEASKAVKLLAEGGGMCSILAGPTVDAIRDWLSRSELPASKITTGVRPFLMSGIGGGIFNCVAGGRAMKSRCAARGATFGHVIGTGEGRAMALLAEWMTQKKVRAVIDSEWNLSEAGEAVEKLKSGRCMGKVVLKHTE